MCGVACAGGSSWGRHHLVAALRSGPCVSTPAVVARVAQTQMRTAGKLGCRGSDPGTVSVGGGRRRVIGGPAHVRSLGAVINHSNNNSKNNNNHPRN